MKPSPISAAMLVVSLLLAPALLPQSLDSANQKGASPPASAAEVPRLIKFGGTLLDAQERPMAGPVGVTFALYSHQTGGAALWVETQNVKPDAGGAYVVLLGANSTNGVPAELFVTGEARWLGIQVGQQPEHERILLVSVPYALKAGDAETLGGLPASAFVTTGAPGNTGNSGGAAAATSSSSTGLPKSATATTPKKAASTPQPATPCTSLTSDGTSTANSIGLFTAPCNLQSSVITQSSGNVGVGTASPAVALDVVGNNVGLRLSGTGTHQVTVTGASSGRLGQDANGLFFASDTNGKSARFLTNNGTLNEWMRITSAGNVGIGTQTPAAKLDINGNLNLPNTASATVGVISLGSAAFIHNFGTNNTFVGAFAGNMSMTGFGSNTAVGSSALNANTTGSSNSALGNYALQANTTGVNNNAFGAGALGTNTTGVYNDAFGVSALSFNQTGSYNNAFGFSALDFNTTGMFNSAFGDSALSRNTTGGANSAFGSSALFNNTTGIQNSAFGLGALERNTDGSENSAFGLVALGSNTIGNSSNAFGSQALVQNTDGSYNNAFGFQALYSNVHGTNNNAFGLLALAANTTGNNNSAFGSGALNANTNTTGNSNSAFGYKALDVLTSGDSNIAVGSFAGNALTAGSGNIYIGSPGVSSESSTIRIGCPVVVPVVCNAHTAAFMAGIATSNVSGVGVAVSSTGQLGVAGSSRRFKEEIADLGGESDLLMKLRPVSFYYKPQYDDTRTRQYGLVAEEVAQVAPQLVVFDKDGAPQTVRYHFVNAMLLNEVQKQQRKIEVLTAEIRDLRKGQRAMALLQARLARLESQQKHAQTATSDKVPDRNNGSAASQGR